jgi:hypothetical protein
MKIGSPTAKADLAMKVLAIDVGGITPNPGEASR